MYANNAVVYTDVIVSQLDQLTVLVKGDIVNSSVINVRRDFAADIICSMLSSKYPHSSSSRRGGERGLEEQRSSYLWCGVDRESWGAGCQ